LAIGAQMSYFVWFLIIASFPISWPISKILDFAIGKDHGTFFNREELKELVALHGERLKKAKNDPNSVAVPHDALSYNEVTIIRGALDLKNKTVAKCLTPLDETFMLDINETMDKTKMALVSEKAHSRVPVYRGERNHIVGMILVRDLLLLGLDTQTPISALEIRRMPMAYASMPLYKLLDIFRSGGSHMAVGISDKDHTSPCGVATLEDVIEELIQEDIEDETDVQRKLKNSGKSNNRSNKADKNKKMPVVPTLRIHTIGDAQSDEAEEERRKSLDDYEQTDINSVYWAQEEDEDSDETKKAETAKKKSFFGKLFSVFV